MLNYIWLTLILIGILTAISLDLYDVSTDRYQTGKKISATVIINNPIIIRERGEKYLCSIRINKQEIKKLYNVNLTEDLIQQADITFIDNNTAYIEIKLDSNSPSIWKEQSKGQQKDGNILHGKIYFEKESDKNFNVQLIVDPVKFVRLNSVTNEGIVKYARTAVELSIGLIGIMTLWLGLMKIAEASGLVQKIAGWLKPITVKLFPDVPADHPAMGAMIMNISANILGLANAATPLGLKAMQELNKLNKKLSTATDAMCTFLVINTSNVQLIPATVIAIRAASGSANPTEILGPVIVATTVSTIVGVITVKLLSKLKIFRKQLEENSK